MTDEELRAFRRHVACDNEYGCRLAFQIRRKDPTSEEAYTLSSECNGIDVQKATLWLLDEVDRLRKDLDYAEEFIRELQDGADD
jgi:hypothetical protein